MRKIIGLFIFLSSLSYAMDVKELMVNINSQNKEIRMDAFENIINKKTRLSTSETIEAFYAFLQSDDVELKVKSFDILMINNNFYQNSLKDNQNIKDTLVEYFKHDDRDVVSRSVYTYTDLFGSNEEIENVLLNRIKEVKDKELKNYFVRGVCHDDIQSELVLNYFVNYFESFGKSARSHIQASISRMKEPPLQFLPKLIASLEDESEYGSGNIVFNIEKYGVDAKKYVPELERVLSNILKLDCLSSEDIDVNITLEYPGQKYSDSFSAKSLKTVIEKLKAL